MKEYEFHKLANLFPLMVGEEFDDLVEDIKRHGQLELITLYEGKILDGRNRFLACKELNKEIKTRKLPEHMNAFDYVISENFHRRHLSSAQKAEVGVKLLDREQEKAKERQLAQLKQGKTVPKSKIPVRTSEDHTIEKGRATTIIAKKIGSSRGSIEKAKKIIEVAKKSPSVAELWEEAKKVRDRSVSIKEVYEIAEIPDEDLRVKEIKERREAKKHRTFKARQKKKLAEGDINPEVKYFNKDAHKLETVKTVCKRAVNELTIAGLEGYSEFVHQETKKMMKTVFNHLKNELKESGEVVITGEVIDIEFD